MSFSVSEKVTVCFAVAAKYYSLNWLFKFQPDGSFLFFLFFGVVSQLIQRRSLKLLFADLKKKKKEKSSAASIANRPT